MRQSLSKREASNAKKSSRREVRHEKRERGKTKKPHAKINAPVMLKQQSRTEQCTTKRKKKQKREGLTTAHHTAGHALENKRARPKHTNKQAAIEGILREHKARAHPHKIIVRNEHSYVRRGGDDTKEKK